MGRAERNPPFLKICWGIDMLKTTNIITSIFLLSLLTSSCAKMLPSIKQTTKSPWQHFEDAKSSFDKIIPKQTTYEDLKQLGFDPFETPNMKLITYLELLEKFMPNQSIQMKDIDPGVQSCLKVRELCQGYEISPQMLNSKRYGNVLLDLFNFKRKKITRGWNFSALIVLKDGLVVHKVWGGEPNVTRLEEKTNPLGPLQDINKVLPPIEIK